MDGFAGRCITTLPPSRRAHGWAPARPRGGGADGVAMIARASAVVHTRADRSPARVSDLRRAYVPGGITSGSGGRTWSGKRDSNSRPQPWQGCALPTELFPRRMDHCSRALPAVKVDWRVGADPSRARPPAPLSARRLSPATPRAGIRTSTTGSAPRRRTAAAIPPRRSGRGRSNTCRAAVPVPPSVPRS